MSRISKQFTIYDQETISARSRVTYTSRSEVVNLAVATFLADIPTAIATLLAAQRSNEAETSPVRVSYMLDSLLLAKMDEQAAKLYLSREQFLRLALDYYLKYLPKQ